MSSSTQPNHRDAESIVRPGAPVYSLPPPLPGVFVIPQKPVWEGVYSNIYRGTWNPGGAKQTVCLKYLRRVDLDRSNYTAQERINRRLLREIVIWQGAQHPNIYPFFGYATVNEARYLVSPWAENGSLEMYLEKHPKTLSITKLRMLRQATQGLAFLHDLDPRIIHGDLKPANILIKEDLVAALCDFGLSRVMVELGLHTGLTTAGGSPGTSGYQAPELAVDDEAGATPQSDIYAMSGVILATMSGVKPFSNKRSPAAVIVAISNGEMCQPCDHPNLPEKNLLWNFLRRCWSPNPSARPTASEMIGELDEAMSRAENSTRV